MRSDVAILRSLIRHQLAEVRVSMDLPSRGEKPSVLGSLRQSTRSLVKLFGGRDDVGKLFPEASTEAERVERRQKFNPFSDDKERIAVSLQRYGALNAALNHDIVRLLDIHERLQNSRSWESMAAVYQELGLKRIRPSDFGLRKFTMSAAREIMHNHFKNILALGEERFTRYVHRIDRGLFMRAQRTLAKQVESADKRARSSEVEDSEESPDPKPAESEIVADPSKK